LFNVKVKRTKWASARAKYMLILLSLKTNFHGILKDFYRNKLCSVYHKKGNIKNTTNVLAIADPYRMSKPRRIITKYYE